MKKILLFWVVLFQNSMPLQAQNTLAQSLFQNVVFQNIGPAIMNGRVVDIDVNEENPIEFYVAYASGGLWYTNNNGTSFTPVMDSAPTQNCGSIAVDWKSGTIWVGTGEVNSSRSSYAGVGLLKSTDKGKTWENKGLLDSHHISKIILNPSNTNEIIVSVVGHLYTTNRERGIFKTIDGGKTWKQTLFVNDETGVIDMAVAPDKSTILYATSWQKERKAYNFKGNGIHSGIYKSTDSGDTWQLLSTKESSFPNNENVGRIGITAFNENIVYAVLDNQNKKPTAKNNNPKDANSALFETDVIGAEIYKSIDAGKTWKKTNDNYLDGLYYTYGYYFGDITVDKSNQDRIYITGVPLLFSNNGGKSLEIIDAANVHGDHHIVWVNPKNPNHIINGNDGGVNISYDNGEHWITCNSNAVGQFYAVNVDEQEPYNVYGGLQDNGVWVGPSNYQESPEWLREGKYPYERLSGGDGMQIQIDKRNSKIVYTGSQYGEYYRIDRANNKETYITPKSKKGENPFRYNWQTPILLSIHNQDIVYFGSNFLHRSMNQGETWSSISGDLTNGKREGNVAYGTLTTISESPFQFGLIYTGSDDGLIHVSKDAGNSWSKISDNLPKNLWVSRIFASSHKIERVYATLNSYRNDDFTSYVYISEDYGQTWKNTANNLPSSPVNVIVEDNLNQDVLYVGTDNGIYISLDKGATWNDFSMGVPNVAVHDLVIQKKAKDLIVGTHGRSIYKTSIALVQQLNSEMLNKSIHVFEVSKIKKWDKWGEKRGTWEKPFEPKAEIWFYSNSDSDVVLQIANDQKEVVYTQNIKCIKGLNKYHYDLSLNQEAASKWNTKNKDVKIKIAENGKNYLPVSKYKISIQKGTEKAVTDFEIVASK